MSDFLQSLVLRAAGLPPVAAALPRSMAAAEPFEGEPALEEVSEEVVAVRPDNAPRDVEPQPAARERETIVERRELVEPPAVIEKQTFARETVRSEMAPPLEDTQQPEAQPRIITNVIEREVIHERQPVVEHIEAAPVVQPVPPAIPVSRETLPESQPQTRVEAREPTYTERIEETRAEPVVLQPIVIRETSTTVQPELRERETRIVETRVEQAAIESAGDEGREEPQPPARVTLEPRRPPQPETGDIEQDDEEASVAPAPNRQPPTANRQPSPAVLIQPSEPAPPPPLGQQQPANETTITIGTIEFRAPQPPPAAPPPPPAPVVVAREPEWPAGFDDYARVRGYTFPEVW